MGEIDFLLIDGEEISKHRVFKKYCKKGLSEWSEFLL
jgi:hypothetical protein